MANFVVTIGIDIFLWCTAMCGEMYGSTCLGSDDLLKPEKACDVPIRFDPNMQIQAYLTDQVSSSESLF